MSQTRVVSFIESISNVIIGLGVGIVSQILIFPIFNINVPIRTNIAIAGWMTLVSILRSYIIRRWFNNSSYNSKFESKLG